MSTLTTRVGPVLITRVRQGNGEVTTIKDTQKPDVHLEISGDSMAVAFRFAVDYVKIHYADWAISPLIGRRIY